MDQYHNLQVHAKVKACDQSDMEFSLHNLTLSVYNAQNSNTIESYEPRGENSNDRLAKSNVSLNEGETFEFTNLYIVSYDLLKND